MKYAMIPIETERDHNHLKTARLLTLGMGIITTLTALLVARMATRSGQKSDRPDAADL